MFKRKVVQPLPVGPSTDALRASVTDAAAVASGLWLSYLFTLFYMLLAAAGVTHKNLFMQDGIKLPFLGIELPLVGFFWLGPVILIIAHGYVLQHLSLLADKARRFDVRVRTSATAIDERDLLPINVFVQMLIGRGDAKLRPTDVLAALVAWLTLVAGPVLVLVFFQLQFLPYHDEATTWWARITVVLDLALVWWMWPYFVCRGAPRWRGAEIGRNAKLATGVLAFAACYLVFFVATFAGEWLEAALPPMPLHQTLVGGTLDENNFFARSLWSNRLILTGVVVFDREKYDTLAKVAAAPPPKSMRSRHLEQAILTEAQLSRMDFIGAHLQGASLVRAHTEGAWFDRADLAGAQLDGAEMEGASFFKAHMVGATLAETQLQGAQMAGANLQGAWLAGAELDGVSLDSADLRRATLDRASLLGASLNNALLQNASLAGAVVEGASLDKAQIFKSDFNGVKPGIGVRLTNVDSSPREPPCNGPPADACDATETPDALRALVTRYVPESENRNRLLTRLYSPEGPEGWEARSTAIEKALASASPWKDLNKDDEHRLAELDKKLLPLWSRIACAGKGAPFGITAVVDTAAADDGWTRPITKPQKAKLAASLLSKTSCAAANALPEDYQMLLLNLSTDSSEAPAPTEPQRTASSAAPPARSRDDR